MCFYQVSWLTINPIHIYYQVSKIDDISLTMTFELYMDLMWEESRWAVIGGEQVTWPWSSSLIGQDCDQRDLAALGPGRQLHGLDQLRAADVAARHPGELWLVESCGRCWAVIGCAVADLHVQAVPQAADRDGRGRAHHLQEPEGSVHSVHRGEAPSLSSRYYSI